MHGSIGFTTNETHQNLNSKFLFKFKFEELMLKNKKITKQKSLIWILNLLNSLLSLYQCWILDGSREHYNRHPVAKSETTNENRKPGASCELLKIASVTAEHYMTCSNTIQGQQKIKLGAFQEAPEICILYDWTLNKPKPKSVYMYAIL